MAVRILLADDHETVRSVVSQLIRNSGHNWEICCEVDNGQAAIQKAKELKPDLFILDVLMPQRDGMSAAREIRQILPNAPIVLYTILGSTYVEEEAKKAGFRVVEKSNPSALVAAIHDTLLSRRPGGGQTPPPRGASPA